MKIYHGSTFLVKKPEIRMSDRYLDFGNGFYTTSSYEQADRWAQKLQIRNNENAGYVSRYEFDYEKAKKDLVVLEFDTATPQWLKFVCDNRRGKCDLEYDIVIGPVADDNVYQVINLFELSIYDESEAIKRLKFEKLFNQILFHTDRSLLYLKYEEYFEGTKK